jgi:hypothetical protein
MNVWSKRSKAATHPKRLRKATCPLCQRRIGVHSFGAHDKICRGAKAAARKEGLIV